VQVTKNSKPIQIAQNNSLGSDVSDGLGTTTRAPTEYGTAKSAKNAGKHTIASIPQETNS